MNKLYVVLLDTLSAGEALAQCAHAIAELQRAQPEAFMAWHEGSNTVVILEAPS